MNKQELLITDYIKYKDMNTALKLEFPEFITHIPVNKKEWIKIGYNKIHATMHFAKRAALVSAMHGYIEKHIPANLSIQGPIETHLKVYVPINYGTMKMVTNKEDNRKKISWNPPTIDYVPNWDIGNLALIWLKCLDDVLIKKGILPDDTITYLRKTTYEVCLVPTLRERKLVYELKTINSGISRNRQRKSEPSKKDFNTPSRVPKS
jgi:hypothetical protein